MILASNTPKNNQYPIWKKIDMTNKVAVGNTDFSPVSRISAKSPEAKSPETETKIIAESAKSLGHQEPGDVSINFVMRPEDSHSRLNPAVKKTENSIKRESIFEKADMISE